MIGLDILVEQAQAGDINAYGTVIRQLQDMAVGYAYSILGDFDSAQDAAQEAFLQAYRELEALREPKAFAVWLRRTVHSQCHRVIRRKRVRTLPLESALNVPSADPGPMAAASHRELEREVHEAIRSLPEHERTATTLYYINGYSQAEVGEFLDVPVHTVKNRLRSARKRLRERMVAMVQETLNAHRPGSEFAERIRRAIELQKSGRMQEASRSHDEAFSIILTLQDEKRYEEAVRLHAEALETLKAQGIDTQCWGNTFVRVARSYYETGRASELGEGILSAMPDEPKGETTETVIGYVLEAVEAFLKARKPERALRAARHAMDLVERLLKDVPGYRFWRGEVLTRLWRIASGDGNAETAARRLVELETNLRSGEKELAQAEQSGAPGADDRRRCLGDAYHNVAFAVYYKSGSKAKALERMRKACELREFPPTHYFLAKFILGTNGDPEEALAHFREALRDPRFRDSVCESFGREREFESVRSDPQFFEALRG